VCRVILRPGARDASASAIAATVSTVAATEVMMGCSVTAAEDDKVIGIGDDVRAKRLAAFRQGQPVHVEDRVQRTGILRGRLG
jgi:predicted thioesterase